MVDKLSCLSVTGPVAKLNNLFDALAPSVNDMRRSQSVIEPFGVVACGDAQRSRVVRQHVKKGVNPDEVKGRRHCS